MRNFLLFTLLLLSVTTWADQEWQMNVMLTRYETAGSGVRKVRINNAAYVKTLANDLGEPSFSAAKLVCRYDGAYSYHLVLRNGDSLEVSDRLLFGSSLYLEGQRKGTSVTFLETVLGSDFAFFQGYETNTWRGNYPTNWQFRGVGYINTDPAEMTIRFSGPRAVPSNSAVGE